MEDIDCSKAQEKVMTTYKNKGYVRDKIDEEALHRAFSPNRVPRGLTKLQVSRRISIGNGKIPRKDMAALISELIFHRIEVRINGVTVLGACFCGKIPKTKKALKDLIKAI